MNIAGSSPAGHPYIGRLAPGDAVRIFTGGVVPEGADAIIIQEDAVLDGNRVTFHVPAKANKHIRAAGLDFKAGDILVRAASRLSARDLSLLAAGDLAEVRVRRKPRIAVAATGDELFRPGEQRPSGGIVASSGYGLAAMIEKWGGEVLDLGIVPDTLEAVATIADHSARADLIVTIGGASVGDHDLIQKALGAKGFELDFWKIAMRPGKPLIFGRLGKTPLLGLPGNPASTLVCAILFLRPALAAMLGEEIPPRRTSARLMRGLRQNDGRQDYLRAKLVIRDGEYWVETFDIQDSSMLSTIASAGALIVRPPHAPPAEAGSRVEIVALENL
jgi:molybdopterin molybdotransferase